MTNEMKFLSGTVIFSLIIFFFAAFVVNKPEPVLTREELIPKGTQITGNPQAKNYLVEFSDFQCPACGAFEPKVQELIRKHNKDLAIAYRHFPLRQHEFAQYAAYSAVAAANQNKFWEMNTQLFANQASFSEAKIDQIAQKVGLDMKKYNVDLKSETTKKRVEADISDGNKFGVDATPTFYLNGKKLQVKSIEDLIPQVEQAMVK